MSKSLVFGGDQIRQSLKELSDKDRTKIYRRATRKALRKHIVPEVRSRIPQGRKPYEHLSRIRRGVKIKSLRDKKNPGSIVVIHGRDIPVGQGESRRFWELRDYAYLVAFGNYKTPNRPTKKERSRGNVRGVGNFMDAAQRAKGSIALEEAISELKIVFDAEITRMARRSPKRIP